MPTPLSHRERVRRALDHRQPDRVPIGMICAGINRPAADALEAYLQRERGIGVDTYLEPILDIRPVAPHYRGPKLSPGTDIWGVHRTPVSYGADSYDEIDHYPLAGVRNVDDLRRHRWPSTGWFDYAGIAGQIAELRKTYDCGIWAYGGGNVFETTWYMRGFEQAFEDLIEQPDLARAISGRVTDFYCEHFRRILKAGQGEIDLAMTADDIGGQTGLLMSLTMWEENLKPFHVRLNRVIHECGCRVVYHSDGAVQDAVPGLLDMGIDVLQALQFDARGMDPARLKESFGDRLCFQGGVSVQHTLPFGTPADVRREVRHLVATLGRGGGYILGPSHCIQAGTPPENIVAMFDTGVEGERG